MLELNTKMEYNHDTEYYMASHNNEGWAGTLAELNNTSSILILAIDEVEVVTKV